MNIKDLFKDVGKNHNSLLVAVIYRKISIPIAKVLYKTPITPNQVTILSGLCAFVAMLLMASPSYSFHLLAVVLIQLDIILDCVDGNLARLRNVSSKVGSWLDTAIGLVTQVLLYFGLAFASLQYADASRVYFVLSILISTRFILNATAAEAEVLFSVRENVDIAFRKKIASKLGVSFSDINFSDDIKMLIICIGLIIQRPFEILILTTLIHSVLLVLFSYSVLKRIGSDR